MKLYKYNVYSLVDRIKEDLNGQFTTFHNTEYEFSDLIASVTGWVDEYWKCESYGFTEPPYYTLISRTADLEVTLIYEDSHVDLTPEEIYELEKLIEKE